MVVSGYLTWKCAITINEPSMAKKFITDSMVSRNNFDGNKSALITGSGGVLSIILGTIISLSVDEQKYKIVNDLLNFVTSFKGNNFTKAILNNTDFTNVNFYFTSFDQAEIIQASWLNTKGHNRIYRWFQYLGDKEVLSLAITRKAKAYVDFSGKNLKGINLEGANLSNVKFDNANLTNVNFKNATLTDASFIDTNLDQVKLHDANLSRARLVRAKLDATDFTGATLTGAYIQDWNITRNTKFDGVRCEFVYMRLPTNEDTEPLRKPDNRDEVFADGEFGDFIQPIFDTLDLYHNQGADPRAIAISFKRLADNHPEAELEIVAMEKRGNNKFLLRAKTVKGSDKSQLSAEYFEELNRLKVLQQSQQLLLVEKDARIGSLETMITNMMITALQQPKFYTQGDTNMTGDRNINTSSGNYNERIQGDYVQGNQYAGQPQSLAEAAAEIQALLKQLEQTYPTATTSEKMVVAAQAIDQIESNPLLKQRVINAIKEGSLAAFEKAIDNPVGAFVVHAIEGWQEVKKD